MFLHQLDGAQRSGSFFSGDEVARRIAALKERRGNLNSQIGRLDSRTHALCGKIEVAAAEQKMMHETAAIIVRNHEKMGIAVKRIEDRYEKIDRASQFIVPEQLSISSTIAELVRLWDGLVKIPPLLQQEQEAVALKFKAIEGTKESLSQELAAIRPSGAAIRHNLLESAEKADQIQQKVQGIQEAKKSMEVQESKIVEGNGQILKQVQKLQETQKEARTLANLQGNGAPGVEEGTRLGGFLGVMSAIIKKIIACSAAVIISVGTLLAGVSASVKQWISNPRWSAALQTVLQPGTMLLIGIAALEAIRRVSFA